MFQKETLTPESDHNSLLEQYGRKNNIEIIVISDGVSDQSLEEKFVYILNEIRVDKSPKDVEACHCVGV